MKRLILFVLVIITSCKNGEDNDTSSQFEIIGLTFDNYPKMDSSTSLVPLSGLIFCKLFGLDYHWMYFYNIHGWSIVPNNAYDDLEWQTVVNNKFSDLVKSSQTHQSILNLINKEADIILSARKMSSDEKKHADASGISIIETSIALDALVVIVNPENTIESLSIEQIKDIYTGKITNWKEIGGNDAPINPYIRNANSGSQELFESMIMKGLNIADFPISPEMIPTMQGVIEMVKDDINSICYTVYYYKEYIQRVTSVKNIAIEGINPNKANIGNNTFPLTAEIYAMIRSDLTKSSTAYKLYTLLQTKVGKEVIRESENIPK